MNELRKDDTFDLLLKIGYVACIALAGVGDSPVLSSLPSGITKVFTMGILALAVLALLVRGDFDNLKECSKYIIVQLLPVLVVLVFSMVVFCADFSSRSTITRSLSKLLFQALTAFIAIAGVYLFGLKSVDLFFYGLVCANAGIMALSLPRYGIGPSIKSVMVCLATFGEADGYVRELEIHDITFVFGQFVLYYALLEPNKSCRKRLTSLIKIMVCIFFFLVGLKRIAVFAAIGVAVLAMFTRRLKHSDRFAIFVCACFFVVAWLYVYVVNSGLFTRVIESYGIDMMGRNNLWEYASAYYEFSPMFLGNGFESVREVMADLVAIGKLKKQMLFHNDFLKIFMELGFWGFASWLGVVYLYYPYYWYFRNPKKAGFAYFVIILYMSFTYLTDNTAFYFWVSIGLRMIPVAIAMDEKAQQNRKAWKLPDTKYLKDEVEYIEHRISAETMEV